MGLIDTLIHEHSAERGFYKALKESISRNRSMLVELISLARFRRNPWLETMGKAGGVFAQWRLKQRGLRPGQLGLVEALEALELGIHGQLLLWQSLVAVAPRVSAWQHIDFKGLIRSAEEQQCRVEAHRISAVQDAFSPATPIGQRILSHSR